MANRARKLIWIFKYLREITNTQLITYIYITLVQSILLYCITIWGGTHKTKFISIERAQKTILKVMLKKKRLFETNKLYLEANVLSVRQLYILQCILKVHKSNVIDPKSLNKRSKHTVISQPRARNKFASMQFNIPSIKMYNKIIRKIKIYTMSHRECKNAVTSYLKTLSYRDTETLMAFSS